MNHYHEKSDLTLLPELAELAPVEFTAWKALQKSVGRKTGAIPRRFRELIALGSALTTQCPYCLDVDAKAAKAAGATREEFAETVFIAAAIRAGGAGTHGALALKLFDEAPDATKHALV